MSKFIELNSGKDKFIVNVNSISYVERSDLSGSVVHFAYSRPDATAFWISTFIITFFNSFPEADPISSVAPSCPGYILFVTTVDQLHDRVTPKGII